ncbi:MAG: MarR family transcriptional regulator [Tistrella sp.]|uniref:MarR family transcriptional regulator n=1 Tax=Tistrella mobilis TaxID=171437 RepID=A0A3B9IET7_9PROT|nr:MarR family transcriptional regulator [Tistrella sp.]MAD38728.1 MarR family transcriptional regulator [Tistrella sp.]MBA76748.1 MarR family transcriptional regulator [Tistrella sp.]HAE46246.1 MarR family transcriptional regulator [Tistrella mobilis]|tara:strand:- start:112 stop:645 length:534 start_codon:yes stop_codon:yes gene_type:complete
MASGRDGDREERVVLRGDELERFRQVNLGRLLDEVHMGFDRRALHYLRESGYPMLNAAHTHVLRTMRFEGSTITDMAARAGISKQAMSKLVAAFEDQGFVALAPDPADARSRIVTVTEDGRRLLSLGIQALKRAEADIARVIGGDRLDQLIDLLAAAREAGSPDDEAPASAYRRRRS